MTNLDSIFKSTDITLLTKVRLYFGIFCEFPHSPLSVSQPPKCCAGSGFRLPWENIEEFVEELNRETQGQHMVPTVTISDIAGLGHFHLLKHLYSLFAFVSPC